MSKRGLPTGIKMRHDAHYVDELARNYRSIGKIVPIDKITPNPEQPRVEIGDLTELTGSIEQNGILEPLLLKPNGDGTWMIIAGERRWRAANLAGLTEVPCIELDIDEQSIAEIALIENLQRKDLTIWEEADGLAYLSRRFNYTHEEIAKKIGKSRPTVTESMTIAGLPNAVREKCRRANIFAKSTLLEIARQFDEAAMHGFLDDLANKVVQPKKLRASANSSPEKNKSNRQIKAAQNSETDDDLSDSSANLKNLKTFRYSSADQNFILEIQFQKNVGFDKRDVLRALKEAFEAVKNQ